MVAARDAERGFDVESLVNQIQKQRASNVRSNLPQIKELIDLDAMPEDSYLYTYRALLTNFFIARRLPTLGLLPAVNDSDEKHWVLLMKLVYEPNLLKVPAAEEALIHKSADGGLKAVLARRVLLQRTALSAQAEFESSWAPEVRNESPRQ